MTETPTTEISAMRRLLDTVGPVPRGLLAVGIYLFAGLFAVKVLFLLAESPEGVARVEYGGLGTGIGIVLLVAFAWLMPPGVRLWRAGVLLRAGLVYVAFLVLWVPVTFWAYPWLLELLGVEFTAQAALEYFTQEPATAWGPVVMATLACLLAPLGEEVVYRGYLTEAVKTVASKWSAVVFVGILFGLAHGVEYALPLAMLGILFGFVRERFDCLAAAIFVHALHNSLTLALVLVFPQMLDVYDG